MEQDQVRIRETAPIQPGPLPAGLALEDPLEVAEELGQAVRDVVLAAAQGLVLLVLVEEADGNGVMAVVDLAREAVEGREHERVEAVDGVLVDIVLGLGREPQAGSQVHEDVGRLAQDQVAVPQEGRRQVRRVRLVAHVLLADHGHDRLGAAAVLGRLLRRVGVLGPGFLEEEAHVLAAAGDPGPVDELVGDALLGGLLALGGGHGGGCGGEGRGEGEGW